MPKLTLSGKIYGTTHEDLVSSEEPVNAQDVMELVEKKRGGSALLINPPASDTVEAEDMDMLTCVEPFGLLRMGTWLRSSGYEVDLLDCLRDPLVGGKLRGPVLKTLPCGNPGEGVEKEIYRYGLDGDGIRRRLNEITQPDFIMITSIFTWHMAVLRDVISACKDVLPAAPVILGGNLPTVCPEESGNLGADAVFVGDVEEARFLPTAIDLMPGEHRTDYVRMIKGCPYECSYCITNFLNNGRVVAREPEDVYEEMLDKHRRCGVDSFVFYDDFVLYRQKRHFDPLIDLVIRERPDFRLEFPLGFSAHVLTEEFVARMRSAGVEVITLALETISETRCRDMNRPHHVREFVRAIDILKAHGYKGRGIRVFYLIGLPGQTLEEILKGILFLLDLGVMPSLTAYTLTPGSRDMERYGERVRGMGLEELSPNLWRFANESMKVRDLDRVYRYFHERFLPVERILGSDTDDPVVGAMQEIARRKGHLPENW